MTQASTLMCATVFHFSGTTPQRRDFTYPPSLTTTRPHAELLDEYRVSVRSKFMADLPELPESDESSLMVSEQEWRPAPAVCRLVCGV